LRPKDKNLIIGRKPVIEALERNAQVEKLLIEEGTTGPFEKQLRELTKKMGFPVQHVPKRKLDDITRANHQGVILVTALIKYYQLDDILQHTFDKGENPLFLILDNITDVRNFGAIARTAEIFGVHAIVIPKKGTAMINEFAIKSSAGALSLIPVCREKNIQGAIELLKLSGVKVYSSDLNSENVVQSIDFTGPSAILIGSEDEGVNKAFIRQSDQTFKIDQKGKTDSLNVSVAAGVILYEMQRQRKN
jgi:23S rRNA (guanosine2251-2'-O)-methyltransferase